MDAARGIVNALALSMVLNGLIGLWLFRFPGLRDWAHRAHANEVCWAFIIIGAAVFARIMYVTRRRDT